MKEDEVCRDYRDWFPTATLSAPIGKLQLNLSARPTINFWLSTFNCSWHPMWYAFTVFQNYKTPTADGTIKTLNNPYFTLIWNNDIELHRSFRLTANAQWATKGDYNNFSNTNKTEAVIYGIRELATANPARRTFLVNLNWKFNEARSKYRGSGAGEKQKARM